MSARGTAPHGPPAAATEDGLLQAYDAVQLATALAARSADPALTEFAWFDQALAAAASAEGFRVAPVVA